MTWLKVIYCQASSLDCTNFSPNRLGVVQLCCYPRLLKAETPYRGRTSAAIFMLSKYRWKKEGQVRRFDPPSFHIVALAKVVLPWHSPVLTALC